MSTRQYIGARYVIKIYENSQNAGSAEWEANVNYEPLTMVTYNYGSYLSKKEVPATVGEPSSNPNYWVQTGFYSGQIASLRADVDQLMSDMVTTNNKIFHIEDFTTYKRGHSIGHSTLQGGCYNNSTDEIIAYVDNHLMRFKSDGTFIMQNDIAFTSHYNAITYNSKTDKVIIGGGGDSLNATLGLAIVNPTTLSLETVVQINGADYIHVVAYDDVNDVYYLIDHSTHGFIVDATTYEIVRTFTPIYDIAGYSEIRQSGFCLYGQFYNMIGLVGLANVLYCYNINGDLIFESNYDYIDGYEPEFISNTKNGVVMGYIDSKLLAQSMMIFDFQSPSVKYDYSKSIYVDETLTDNGDGTDAFPYNDLAFAAYDARGKNNVSISLRSDTSKHGVVFSGINRLIFNGAGHEISNPDVDGVGIYFRCCSGDVINCKFKTHVRADTSNLYVSSSSFEDIASTWAFVASNVSNVHLQAPEFNNCATCTRVGTGSRLSVQSPTGSGNNLLTLIQNCSEFICSYSAAISTTDVSFTNSGFAVVNGVATYQ